MLSRVEDLNLVVGYFGLPQYGKTHKAAHDFLREANRLESFKFVADYNSNFPKIIQPSKTPFPVVQHPSLVQCAMTFRTITKGIHRVNCDGMELIKFAAKVSETTFVDRGEHRYGYPSFLLIDDIVKMARSNPKKFDSEFLSIVANRRHAHIALYYTSQSPYLTHRQLLNMTTKAYIFRTVDQIDINRFRQMQIPREITDKLPKLEKYQYIEVDIS